MAAFHLWLHLELVILKAHCAAFLSLHLKKCRSTELSSLPNKVMFMMFSRSSHCSAAREKATNPPVSSLSLLGSVIMVFSFCFFSFFFPRHFVSLFLSVSHSHLPLFSSFSTQRLLIFQLIFISFVHFSFLFPLSRFFFSFLSCLTSFSHLYK